nr:UL34 [Human alphaherpesvirus 2]
MPRVQLAFRFMGPEDAVRTRRILCRAAEQALARRRRSRRSQDDYGAVAVAAAHHSSGAPGPGVAASGPPAPPGRGPARPWHQAVQLFRAPRPGPPALLLLAAGLFLGAAIWWAVGARL